MSKFLVTSILILWLSSYVSAQKINLVKENITLQQAMNEIKKQEFAFYSDTALTVSSKLITVHIVDEEIQGAMEKILNGQPFTYELRGTSIILIYTPEKTNGSATAAGNRTKSLEGIVRNQVNEPLEGVIIRSKQDPKKVTATNAEGWFKMCLGPGDTTIVISHLGYQTLQYTRNGRGKERFTLNQECSQLAVQNVRVTKGYYSTISGFNTGNVSTIKSDEISRQPVSDVLMALEGRVTGLNISQKSGIVGAEMNVNIRGLNSMQNGNAPLYVIDGVPFYVTSLNQAANAPVTFSPLTNIRPEDIESITILKDADATAIYGSRAANGVILITSKKLAPGRTKFDVNLYTGIGHINRKLDLMNTPQYLQMRREALSNDHSTGLNFDDVNGKWDTTRYTDWQKMLIGGTARVLNVQMGVSGGNGQTQFRIAGKYRYEGSVYPGDFYNSIRSVSGAVQHTSENARLRLLLNASYTYNTYYLPQTDLTKSIYVAPNAPVVYLSDGELNWANNTFINPAAQSLKTSNNVTDNLLGNLQVTYQLTPDIQFLQNFGYNAIMLNELTITPFSAFMPSTPNAAQQRVNNSASNSVKTWIYEPQINYGKTYKGMHRIDFTTGATFQESINKRNLLIARGFDTDGLILNPGAAANLNAYPDNSKYTYNALFVRLGYRLMDRYILNLTGRKDGSSRLGPDKRFGYFGAIGASWIFSEEKFIKDKLRFLHFGKLRGSYGKTGNDQIVDYQYMSTYAISLGYGGNPGLAPMQLTNHSFGWEVIKKSEVAMELGFCKKVILEASLYRNLTTNQLVNYSMPATTGGRTVTTNIPARIENKGLELNIRSENIKRKHFTWESNLNITFLRNTFLSYPNFQASGYIDRYAIGYPLTVKYLYHFTGIDRINGLATFQQSPEDNILNKQGKTPVFIGQYCFGGISNTITYKRVTIDLFFHFVKQTGYNSGALTTPGRYIPAGSNQPKRFLDRWQTPGDQSTYQKYSNGDFKVISNAEQYTQSDAMIEDASFIRLKNVSASWLLPERVINRFKLQNARVYLEGQNLLTITRFGGIDPETIQYGQVPALPPLRTIVAGIQVTL
jgi:TonB-linked SusC/RagA family outer membrane protein